MKKKVVIIFGGRSYEHEVSINSAKSIMKYINKDKYEIKLIYIDKSGQWLLCNNINSLKNLVKLNDFKILNWCDVVFPVLHGNYGEDGKIQGLFDMLDVAYVGCNLKSSCNCMDKEICKVLLNDINIPQTPYIVINKNNYDLNNTLNEIKEKIGYPCFIKPANSGSSIGINKIYHESEVNKFVIEAFKFDDKIIIEKYIRGREVEIGVLGNDDILVSNIGEIIAGDDFYSYDDKYNSNKSIVKVPVKLNKEIERKIKEYAKKAYKKMECSGLSRIDFFIENSTNEIYLNEINTMPGFTNISMYPVLFEDIGIKYDILIDTLIDLGIKKHTDNN